MAILDMGGKDRRIYRSWSCSYAVPAERLEFFLADLDEALERESKQRKAHAFCGLYPADACPDVVGKSSVFDCLKAYRERRGIEDLRGKVVRMSAPTVNPGKLQRVGVIPALGAAEYLTVELHGDTAQVEVREVLNLAINPAPIENVILRYARES